ncbi:hypothetical protein ACIGXM_03180 [Kitasatospora sp. NPDC052896]|uniref:hypothetical protein n=1 Tax=Kitasatospora sp. NPDC052896 TaxID=3364061 RepID=UPI0037CA1D5E
MQLTAKRSVALAIAGLAVGTVGALTVPALASSQSVRVANVPSLTLDFNGTNDEAGSAQSVGSAFGGTARVRDTNGNFIGTAYDLCDKDRIGGRTDEVFCTGLIEIKDQGKISFSVVLPISNDPGRPDDRPVTGVVSGGTGAFEGITGEARLQPRQQGVYDLNFS